MTCENPTCYLDDCEGGCARPDPAPWSSVCDARDAYWAALGRAKHEVIGESGAGAVSSSTRAEIERATTEYVRTYCAYSDHHNPGWRSRWPLGAPSGNLRQVLEDAIPELAARSAEASVRAEAWMAREISGPVCSERSSSDTVASASALCHLGEVLLADGSPDPLRRFAVGEPVDVETSPDWTHCVRASNGQYAWVVRVADLARHRAFVA